MNDFLCLAIAIYFEARGESLEGQQRVAEVVVNRVDHPFWPGDVCSVLEQPRQFSFYRGEWRIPEVDLSEYVFIAQRAMSRKHKHEFVFFWNPDLTDRLAWTRNLEGERVRLGNHVFSEE